MSVKVSEFEFEQPNAEAEDTPDWVGATDLDEGSAFQAELARAMQETAGLERARIGEDADRRRQEHIDSVRVREATDANRMRDLAAEDMKAIDAWVEAETKRIELERERRVTELNDDLETSLALHSSKVGEEIERVDAAIAGYRAEVDAFFDGLDRETDPVLIAQQAARRPSFPALDVVSTPAAADARGAAGDSDETEPTVVGVMDTEAEAEPVESWVMPPETSPEPATDEALDGGDVAEDSETADRAEPVRATASVAGHSSVGSILESVPVLRPMSWLWRDGHGGDRANGDH